MIKFAEEFVDVGEVAFWFPGVLCVVVTLPLDEILDTMSAFTGGEDFFDVVFGEIIDNNGLWWRRRNLAGISRWVVL